MEKRTLMTTNLAIPQIRLANVISGAALDANEKGANETFIGLIETDTEQHRAYIKVLGSRQLVNELVCSTLGQAAGLPIPEGFIVRATSTELPESSMLANHKGEALIFACADVGRPSLKRRLAQDGNEFAQQFLADWEDGDATAIFDEWIANPDRHPGNLLVEGPGKVWLIDHGHSFTGPNWKATDLVPDRAVKNQVADEIFPRLTLPGRMAVRTKAAALAKLFGIIKPDAALSACHAAHFMNLEDLAALRNFVAVRVDKIFDLVSTRLGIPNMGV